jgi:hypothetical protein
MDLLKLLSAAESAIRTTEDMANRETQAYLGIVTNNADLTNNRRVKVLNPANPTLESHWLRRLDITKGQDAPVPAVGQTVLVISVEGSSTNGYYLTLINDTNPAHNKADAINDYSFQGESDYDVKVEKSITFTTSSGCSLKLSDNGDINITAAKNITVTGEQIDLEAETITNIKSPLINLAGNIVSTGFGGNAGNAQFSGNVEIINASNVSVNNKQVATVGAIDTDGDALVTKGW